MDKQQIFRRLQQITGTLRTFNKDADLDHLERQLAIELAMNPYLEITGTRSPQKEAETEMASESSKRFDYLTDLLDKKALTD